MKLRNNLFNYSNFKYCTLQARQDFVNIFLRSDPRAEVTRRSCVHIYISIVQTLWESYLRHGTIRCVIRTHQGGVEHRLSSKNYGEYSCPIRV